MSAAAVAVARSGPPDPFFPFCFSFASCRVCSFGDNLSVLCVCICFVTCRAWVLARFAFGTVSTSTRSEGVLLCYLRGMLRFGIAHAINYKCDRASTRLNNKRNRVHKHDKAAKTLTARTKEACCASQPNVPEPRRVVCTGGADNGERRVPPGLYDFVVVLCSDAAGKCRKMRVRIHCRHPRRAIVAPAKMRKREGEGGD